jgi:cobalt-zinc-cadmium efflux system membrane fusion protein
MHVRKIAIPLLAALFALVPATGCKRNAPAEQAAEKAEPEKKEEALPSTVTLTPAAIAEAGIKTWKVTPTALGNQLVLNGNVAFNENRMLVVSSTVGGRVAQIAVDLGQPVRKGQPIAWVESRELAQARQEYLRALTELRIAEQSYERAKLLVAGKAISAGEFQTRQGDYESKRTAANAAETTLRQLGDDPAAARNQSGPVLPRIAIRAPFDGHVIDRKVTPGSLVEALHPLVTVADLHTLWVFFQVYEKDLANVSSSMPITITADAYPNETFTGKIDFIGREVDPGTRTLRVRATVENRQLKLRPGLFVKGRVNVERPRDTRSILGVPQSAVQTLEGRPTIFLRTAANTFTRRFVETGSTYDEFIEVLNGVAAGDEIVTDGSFVLKAEFSKASLAEDE